VGGREENKGGERNIVVYWGLYRLDTAADSFGDLSFLRLKHVVINEKKVAISMPPPSPAHH
jgi:hypothetical protein